MKIDSSSSSLISQMNQTQKKLSKTFEKLATGKRVNSAADDPSALALGNSLESAIRSLSSINQGVSLSQGALETASGGLSATMESLQRARELAVQASNGTLSDSDRASLQQEYDQQLQSIDQNASQTNFNGNNLLDGSFSQSVTTGTNGESTNISVGSSSTSALGISATGISNQSSAEDAIEAIDSAIANVQSQQANIGATQNSLEFSSNARSVQAENLAAAQSNAIDADLAEVSAQLKQQQIQLQAQIAAAQAQSKNAKNYSKAILGKAS